MRLLSWNCRGIGRAPTARSLKALVRDEGPDVLFLAETKVSSPRLEKLKVGMGFSNFFCVDSEGKAGGLAIFWKLGVELEVVFSNSHIIAALVYSDPPDNVWLLLAVYGPPYFSKRKKFWNLMEDLISRFDGSWLMIGDLNSVSKCSEKKGRSSSAINSSRSFHHFVSEVGAIDLGFSGPKFTWTNKRVGWANVRERLDRGLCNVDWQSLFPNVRVRHLLAHNSDHNPIILDTHLDLSKGVKPFRFEAMWTRDDSSSDVVSQAWSIQVNGSHHYRLAKKFQKVQKDFKVWNRTVFGLTRARIRDLEERLKLIQEMDPSQENLSTEAALQLEINEWLEREEVKWRQKSRELWLKEGDRNSKFFHLSTLVRRRKNYITEIQLDSGRWIHSKDDIADYFTLKFSNVFHSSLPQIPSDMEGLLESKVSDAENALLSRVLDADQVKKVVWEMNSHKAPGPDGLPGLFFKKYWDTVGMQVIAAVQSFFRDGWLLSQMNHTYITLIPKRQGASNFNQFRPISLCNFYYKIISKILVLRLRPILPKLIDPAQVAFVPDRWIAENVVLAQEVVHTFHNMKRKKGSVGFKLDFKKAYDSLEWDFILAVM
jgi:hypothetical protein